MVFYNLTYLIPSGLVLEKIGFWFKHGTIMQNMIWELNKTNQLEVMTTQLENVVEILLTGSHGNLFLLIQRRSEDVPPQFC